MLADLVDSLKGSLGRVRLISSIPQHWDPSESCLHKRSAMAVHRFDIICRATGTFRAPSATTALRFLSPSPLRNYHGRRRMIVMAMASRTSFSPAGPIQTAAAVSPCALCSLPFKCFQPPEPRCLFQFYFSIMEINICRLLLPCR
jgi:hypothetical protein